MKYIVEFKGLDLKRQWNTYMWLVKKLESFLNESPYAAEVNFKNDPWGYYEEWVMDVDNVTVLLEYINYYFASVKIEQLSKLELKDNPDINGYMIIDADYMIKMKLEEIFIDWNN